MLGQAKSRSRKPMKLVTIALYIATSPFTICAAAAFAALALASAAGNYLTNPQSVVAVASPPVRQIISVPEAQSQSIPGVPSASGSAQANIPFVGTVPPSPGLQPFTSNEPTTTIPASTQQVRSSASLTQDPLFWSCGAIVVGCITGCLMISRQLSNAKAGASRKTMPSRSKVFVPLPPDQMPRSGYRDQPALGYASVPVAALPVGGYAPLSMPHQPAGKPSRQQRQPMRTRNSGQSGLTATPQVTVLPQTAVHPLDWNDPGLASQLDVRKSRPLSSWQ